MNCNTSIKTVALFNILAGMFFFVFLLTLCPISAKEKSSKTVKAEKLAETVIKIGDDEIKTDNAENKAVQENQYEYEKPVVEEESYVWLIFKTLLVLAFLVGGFYFFYKFVTKKTGMHILGRDVIKILSVVPVGQNKFLQVVDLAGRIIVIGVSDSSINLITEITDRNEIDRIRLLSSKSSPINPGGFQDYISKYIAKLFKKDDNRNSEMHYENIVPESEIQKQDKMEYLKKQRERLKKINGNDHEI